MTYPVIQPSFAAGELSPQLFARVDYAKYHSGLARCYNCIVDFRGGAFNRPGTQYIINCFDQAHPIRMIPFKFSTIQNYALEFGNGYMRPFMNGGTILEPNVVISGLTQANPAVVTAVAHGYTTGDIVFINSVGGMTQVNGRYFKVTVLTANTFSLANLDGAPINSTGYSAYTAGGISNRVYMIASPYLGADVARLKYTQSADTMTITHPSYPPYKLTRTSHTTWAFAQVNFASSINIPQITSIAADTGGANTLAYRITAVAANGEESLPSVIAAADVGANANVQITWNPIAGAVSYNIYRSQLGNIVYNSGTYSRPYAGYGLLNYVLGTVFTDNALTGGVLNQLPDFTISPPVHQNPFAIKPIVSATVTAAGAGYTDATVINIADATGTGAILKPVIVAGALTSIIVESGGNNYTAPALTFTVGAGGTATATLGPATNTYPGVCSYFQQRAMYAASFSLPQSFWMSKTGAFDNMDISNPIVADDAITATIVAQQVNDIRSLTPMPSGIIAFTSDAAWEISGGGQGAAVTPLNILAKPQAYVGASFVQPLLINYDVLYIQSKGGTIRDLSFNFYYNAYVANDISSLSNHLFFGYEILDWAWAQDPFRVVWALRSDAVMLSLTFAKEQEVYAWAQHSTFGGGFESVCSIPEGNEDAVYFSSVRTLNGVQHKFIERMFTRNLQNNIIWSRFLDAALEYAGGPITVVTGLEHLEGMTVTAIADGVEVAGLVVANRQVTLPSLATIIAIGLPYVSELQNLPIDVPVEKGGTSQGRFKRITTLTARVLQSRSLQMGTSFSTLKASKVTTTPVTNSPFGTWTGNMFTGDDRMVIDSVFTEFGQVCIRQSHPYPMTVLGIIPALTLGDTPDK